MPRLLSHDGEKALEFAVCVQLLHRALFAFRSHANPTSLCAN